jgi:DNA repair exonuclease SbcCD ATPase subunit
MEAAAQERDAQRARAEERLAEELAAAKENAKVYKDAALAEVAGLTAEKWEGKLEAANAHISRMRQEIESVKAAAQADLEAAMNAAAEEMERVQAASAAQLREAHSLAAERNQAAVAEAAAAKERLAEETLKTSAELHSARLEAAAAQAAAAAAEAAASPIPPAAPVRLQRVGRRVLAAAKIISAASEEPMTPESSAKVTVEKLQREVADLNAQLSEMRAQLGAAATESLSQQAELNDARLRVAELEARLADAGGGGSGRRDPGMSRL